MKTLSDAWLDKAWNIAGELVALNNIPRHRLFGYIIAEHLTGAFSCAKRAADPNNEAATCATHCGDFARCITAPASALAASAPSQAELVAEFDVRKILLDVVPGEDGMGHEVYAKTVADVERKLSELGEALENFQLGIAPSQAGSCQASGAACDHCGGTGELFTHAEDCADELCALNGDEHSCTGRVEQCVCRDTAPPAGRTLTASCVGDTRFEGWLSESGKGGKLFMYGKSDMRDAYWAGYQERAASSTTAGERE